jgi:hypothetical protein
MAASAWVLARRGRCGPCIALMTKKVEEGRLRDDSQAPRALAAAALALKLGVRLTGAAHDCGDFVPISGGRGRSPVGPGPPARGPLGGRAGAAARGEAGGEAEAEPAAWATRAGGRPQAWRALFRGSPEPRKRRERRQPRRVVIAARSDSRVLHLSCLVWRVRLEFSADKFRTDTLSSDLRPAMY